MDRKALIRQYKENPRPAGVFVVRNIIEGKALLGVSTDLPGMLNRQRFQLEMGSHPDRDLQSDWNRLGPEAFGFEVLDELQPLEQATDAREHLAILRDEWASRLSSAGETLYRWAVRGT